MRWWCSTGECQTRAPRSTRRTRPTGRTFPPWPERETPFSQLPDIYAALDLLGVKHLETDGCEADDLIAAYALACRGGALVTILSLDSDFFQLIDETVRVYRYRGDRSVLCTEEYVRARFGVRAAQYADFKCLVGDPSDNIPGVRGVGPKIAARLLARFETLEGVLAGAEGEGGVARACGAARGRRAAGAAAAHQSCAHPSFRRGCAALPAGGARLRTAGCARRGAAQADGAALTRPGRVSRRARWAGSPGSCG